MACMPFRHRTSIGFFLAAATLSAHAVDSQPHALVMGLACSPAAPSLLESPHDWDARLPRAGAHECLDGEGKVRLHPTGIRSGRNSFSKNPEVVIEISEAEGRAIGALFSKALQGTSRGSLILLDGKVITAAYVNGPFAGTTLEIDPGSEDATKTLVAMLSDAFPKAAK